MSTANERLMQLLSDVPGDTLLDRVTRLRDWYLQMQVLVEQLKTENERLKAEPRIRNFNPNSFM